MKILLALIGLCGSAWGMIPVVMTKGNQTVEGNKTFTGNTSVTGGGGLTATYGVLAASGTFTGGLTASSGTFTNSGTGQYALAVSTSITFTQGLVGVGIRWADGTISTSAVAALADGSITTAKLASDSVIAAKILTGSVTTNKLASDAVTEAKILTASVTTSKLATDAVSADKILSGAVTTSKLNSDLQALIGSVADGAITTNKLASDAVIEAKILNASVTTNKLGTDSVITAKIQNLAITTSKLNADIQAQLASVGGSAVIISTDKWISGSTTDTTFLDCQGGTATFVTTRVNKFAVAVKLNATAGSNDAASSQLLVNGDTLPGTKHQDADMQDNMSSQPANIGFTVTTPALSAGTQNICVRMKTTGGTLVFPSATHGAGNAKISIWEIRSNN